MKFDLTYDGTRFGTATFSSDARRLTATRAADGMILALPVDLTLPHGSRFHGYLSELRVAVSHHGVELGSGGDPLFVWGSTDRTLSVRVPLSAAALATIERQRNGNRVTLNLVASARIGAVLVQERIPNLLSRPDVFHHEGELELDRDRWVELLRSTGWGDNVIVDLALPPMPSPPWDEVWKAVRLARDSFDKGGPGAGKTCIGECRTAFEAWARIEALDTGPANAAPRTLTRRQRLDVLRQDLHRYAHEAVHTTGDQTTRDEAAMVLASLVGMLGVRAKEG